MATFNLTNNADTWLVSKTIAASGTISSTLNTKDTFLDRDINVSVITPAVGAMSLAITDKSTTNITIGTLSGNYYPLTASLTGTATFSSAGWITTAGASATDNSVTVGRIRAGVYDTSISSSTNSSVTPSVTITSASTYGFKTTTPDGNYLTINPNATATAWSATPYARVTTAGYIPTGSITGDAVSTTPIINDGTNYYVPITQLNFSGGDLSIDTNTNTITKPSITIEAAGTFISASDYGVTQDQPAGENGTDYLTITENHPVTVGSAVSNYTISRAKTTYTNIAGVIAAHTSAAEVLAANSISGTKTTTINPTIVDNFNPYYIPITSVTVSGGTLTKTDYSTTPTININNGNSTNMDVTNNIIMLGAKDTTTYPYYFKINTTTNAINGTTTVSRSAIKYSNAAGAIIAHTNKQTSASTSASPTVTINAGSNDSYINLKSAVIASEGAITTPLSIAITNSSTMTTTNTATNYYITIGATPTNGIIQTKYKVTQAGYTPTITATNGGTVTVIPEISGTSKIYIPAAAITTSYSNSGLSTYFTAGTSSDKNVTITPKYTNTVGYIPATTTATNNDGIGYWKIKTTSITKGNTSVSGSTVIRGIAVWSTGWITGGSIAAASFSNSATSGITYVDISNTTAAPMLSSGGYLYINKGYVDNLKISLAKLIPDWPSGTQVATADYILQGYKAYNQNGGILTGTIPTKQASDVTFNEANITIPKGYFADNTTISMTTGNYDASIASYTKGSVTPKTTISSASTYGFDTTVPSSGTYITVTPGADITAWSATPKAEITVAGYLGTGSKNGTKIEYSSTLNTGTKYYAKVITPILSGGDLSITTNSNTVTKPKITIEPNGTFFTTANKNLYGIVTDQPQTGSYLTINEKHSTQTNGSAISNFKITRAVTTYSSGKGVISAHTNTTGLDSNEISGSQETAISIDVTDSFATHYIPISTISFSGGALSVKTNYTGTPTISFATGSDTNMSNITFGTKDTTNYPYYFKLAASSSSLSGTTKVDLTQLTYTNIAGVIAANTGASALSGNSKSPTVTIHEGNGNTYIGIKAAALTITGSGVATEPTLIADTTAVSGKTRVAGTPDTETSSITKYYMAFKATAPATTISFSKTGLTKGYLNAASQITCNSSSTTTASNTIYYVPLASAVLGAEGSVQTAPTASITQSTSMVTTTANTGYYFKIDLAKTNGTVYTKYKATTAGYTPTVSATRDTTGNVTVTPTTSIDADTTKTTKTVYIQKAEGSITMTAGAGSCSYDSCANIGIATTDTTGIKITFKGSGSVSATAKVTTAGYTPTNNSFATGAATSSNSATASRWITGVKLTPPSSGTRTFKIVVPNGNTTDYIDFRFTVDSSGNVTVDSSGSNTL